MKVATAVKFDGDLASISFYEGSCILDGFTVFAVPGATSKAASHMLAVALAARAAGKPLYIRYRLTPNTVPGCPSSNCRELLWIGDWGA